jgi:hypothetical protein
MHPPHSKHVCFLSPAWQRLVRGAAGLAALLLLAASATGCEGAASGDASGSQATSTQAARSASSGSPFAPPTSIGEPSEAERDSAIRLLSSMQRAVFDSAFVRLDDRAFTRTVRTEKLDSTDTPVARREQTVRYRADGGPGELVSSSDSGQGFDRSSFASLLPSSSPTDRPVNLAAQAFPEKPAYLSARTREAFRYRVESSTYRGTPVSVVRVQAREGGMGREQSVRFAELTIARDSRELLAATAVRAEHVLLFQEDSRLVVRLRPADTTWLPAQTTFHAHVDVPFREPVRVRTRSAFEYR